MIDRKCFFEKFGQLSFAIHKNMKILLTEGVDPALSMPHIYLLEFINVHGPCIVTDISNYLGITLSGVTSLLNKLVDMKLVSRERSEEDRRIVRVFLTEEGEKTIDKVKENKLKLFEKCFNNFSDQEMNIFFEIQNKITENLLKIDTL